jgi:methionyl aminopeptidase
MFRRSQTPGRTAEQLLLMRRAGLLVGQTLERLRAEIRPGVTTLALDALAEDFIRSHGGIPNFHLFPGYLHTLCTSVNDEVVHGIPSPRRRLADGDVVSIDVGCIVDGWHADCARTWVVGEPTPEVARLVDATRRGMEAGIAAALPGNHLGDIGHAIESMAREHGYGIVRPFVGHGIGQSMHEEPQVPNYGRPGAGMLIESGMCFAIEPMYNLGGDDVYVEDDGWTVRTVDGALSAHFENTIAVTDDGPDVLTERP